MKYIKMFEKVVKELYYNANGLGTLPKLPKSLIKLYCYGNRLTELPELPNGLEELYCSDNKLTKLPELPKSLRILSCYDNNLEKLIAHGFKHPLLIEGRGYEKKPTKYQDKMRFKEWLIYWLAKVFLK